MYIYMYNTPGRFFKPKAQPSFLGPQVLGATNRPQALDSALVRPGRRWALFGFRAAVGLPLGDSERSGAPTMDPKEQNTSYKDPKVGSQIAKLPVDLVAVNLGTQVKLP